MSAVLLISATALQDATRLHTELRQVPTLSATLSATLYATLYAKLSATPPTPSPTAYTICYAILLHYLTTLSDLATTDTDIAYGSIGLRDAR
eukprot:1899689-Rhodomonas_salina.1